jgi:hypothetical protein
MFKYNLDGLQTSQGCITRQRRPDEFSPLRSEVLTAQDYGVLVYDDVSFR